MVHRFARWNEFGTDLDLVGMGHGVLTHTLKTEVQPWEFNSHKQPRREPYFWMWKKLFSKSTWFCEDPWGRDRGSEEAGKRAGVPWGAFTPSSCVHCWTTMSLFLVARQNVALSLHFAALWQRTNIGTFVCTFSDNGPKLKGPHICICSREKITMSGTWKITHRGINRSDEACDAIYHLNDSCVVT